MSKVYDIIIIGGGAVGLASAYYAAQAKKQTIVLEQYDFFNDKCSSGGVSRQFRLQYNEKELTQLVLDSIPLWQELQSHSDEQLLDRVGCLWFGNPGVTGPEGKIDSVTNVLDEMRLSWKNVDNIQIENDYNFKDLPEIYCGFFQENGAAINYSVMLKILFNQAKNSGYINFQAQQKVTAINSKQDVVTVITSSGKIIHGKKLIIAPGPYANQVFSLLGFQLDIVVWEMVTAYFKKTNSDINFPTWITFDNPRNGRPMLYYGFPDSTWDKPGYVKVAATYASAIHRDNELDNYKQIPDTTTLDNISYWVKNHMQGLDPEPINPATCLCGIIPQKDNALALRKELVLDFAPGSVPNNKNIIACATGWVAKLAPLMGKICVDLATKGSTEYNLENIKIETIDLI